MTVFSINKKVQLFIIIGLFGFTSTLFAVEPTKKAEEVVITPKNVESTTTFSAYVFDGARTAQKVLYKLEDSPTAHIWIDDVAMISKNKLGFVRINSTWAQNNLGAAGFGWGAFTGALLGAMTGPGGALAGATMGGSLYGLLGASVDLARDDPNLNKFAKSLKKDTSALVLVTNEGYLENYNVTLTPYGGTAIQVKLNQDDVQKIKKNLK
jgi:uncharacterized membrane protein